MELREMSVQAFERFAALLPEPVLLLNVGGRILFANRTARAAFGLPGFTDEVISLIEFTADEPNDLEQYLRACRDSTELLPGSVALPTESGAPAACPCEAGRLYAADDDAGHVLLFRLLAVPGEAAHARSSSGEVEALSREIAWRRQVEAELAEERERFRVMADSAPVMIWVSGTDKRCTYFNRSWLEFTGRTVDQEAGHGWAEGVHPDDYNRCTAIYGGSFDRREPFVMDYRLRRHDGEHRWVLDHGVPRYGSDGEFAGYIGSCIDITDRRRVEDELHALNERLEHRVAERTRIAEERAAQLRLLAAELTRAEQQERRRLARALHDDLQQLLVAARMHVGVLRSGRRSPEVQIEQIDQLLGESVQKSRTLTLELSPPILYDRGLAPALEWLARWMQEKYGLQVNVAVDARAEPEDESIRILLFEAVRELLFNVIKHAGVDTADVRMQCVDPDLIEAAVRDAGTGFDPVEFEEHGGTTQGFGLSSLRYRLELLGGELRVQSAAGEGTAVVLRARRSVPLPSAIAAPLPAEETSEEGRESPRPYEGPRIRILLADDHAIVREGIAGLLEDYPEFEIVGQAVDGADAVELARLLTPDVVIMDINMPRIDGVEATRQIMQELPQTRVIALSLQGEREMDARMREAGAAACLPKDGAVGRLVAAIRTVFA